MFEAADLIDLRRLGMMPQQKAACPHCGSTNPNPVDYLWLDNGRQIFGCCSNALVKIHGANPSRVIKQTAPSFIAD